MALLAGLGLNFLPTHSEGTVLLPRKDDLGNRRKELENNLWDMGEGQQC
jgi:hypothetical protein